MYNLKFNDIKNLTKMEQYINSPKDTFNSLSDIELQEYANKLVQSQIVNREGQLTCFENGILQNLSRYMSENQLFFIIKNPQLKLLPVELLLQKYNEIIFKKYDSHQMIGVGRTNDAGEIWVKKHNYKREQIWNGLRESFEPNELTILLDNQDILIFTISLKCSRIVFDVDKNKMLYYEDGFMIKENRPYDIVPYPEPYCYHYQLLGYYLLQSILGKEMMNRLSDQYKHIENDMIKTVKKEREVESCKLTLQKKIS